MRSLQGMNTMTSQPIRDQVEDHLITPKNAALLIIDYQPPQVSAVFSIDHLTLVSNIVATARLARLFALPIVLSTVNVKAGGRPPTIHQLAEVLAGIEALDRTTINACEDAEFVPAVQAGAQPTSLVQLMCELQRDWARTETVQPVREILFAREGR